MARAGDAPDFSSLEARVRETQTEVRRVFRELLENSASLRVGHKQLSYSAKAEYPVGITSPWFNHQRLWQY